ncbi:hypothetical protein AGMMS49938_16540 [Fibrobacterales bacterium]|nr:hypothetical protein AGMMS49938_16540 [Fibrobacterales bacterium]
MNKKMQFKATLQMLTPMVIQIIMEKKVVSVQNATEIFYKSKIYETLENEKTKLWHLSPLALFELLEIELSGNPLIYPEES